MRIFLGVFVGVVMWFDFGFTDDSFSVSYPTKPINVKDYLPYNNTDYFNEKIDKTVDTAIKEKALKQHGPTNEKAEVLKELKEKEKNKTITEEEKRILGNYRNSMSARECKSQELIATAVKYSSNQKPFCYFTRADGYGCKSGICKNIGENGTTLRVFPDGTSEKQGINLMQSFLSVILGYVIKFGAMLAVLAIVIGGIQVSMNGDSDGESPIGKDKIMGGIAALVVLFFTGVILHFINPGYFVW
ncbi:pilin [Candidatus Gracilibacteria bacterium]|nr:pilin [Candidatus Gracilibacteria bacterium]